MRMGLASLLGSEPGMEIAGDAEDGRGGENIVDIYSVSMARNTFAVSRPRSRHFSGVTTAPLALANGTS